METLMGNSKELLMARQMESPMEKSLEHSKVNSLESKMELLLVG